MEKTHFFHQLTEIQESMEQSWVKTHIFSINCFGFGIEAINDAAFDENVTE